MKRFAVVMAVMIMASFVPVLTGSSGATTNLPQCTHLVAASTTVIGGDGVNGVVILLANVGGRCELKGYATVQFFESRFTHLIGRDLHHDTMIFASPKPARITLAHGMDASFGVSWTNDREPHQTCSRTRWVNVVLPDPRRTNFQPSRNAVPCGVDIWVTPFERGAQPQLEWNAPPS